MTPDEIEDLVQTTAGWYLEYLDSVDAALKPLSDDDLRAIQERKPHTALLERVAYEVWQRKMLRRVEEVGADVYCVQHDCAWDNCPPEAHE